MKAMVPECIDYRNAPTMSDLIDRYLKEYAANLSERSRSDQTSLLRKMVEPEWVPAR